MLFPIAILQGDDTQTWGVEVPNIPGCFLAGDDLLTTVRERIAAPQRVKVSLDDL